MKLLVLLAATAALIAVALACEPLTNCLKDCVLAKDINGCQVCECSADPTTGGCALGTPCQFCQYGYKTDANGCNTCTCLDAPVCPDIACATLVPCPYGYAFDEFGCPKCECAAAPDCSNIACRPVLCEAGYAPALPPGECCTSCFPVDPLPCAETATDSTVTADGLLVCPDGTELSFDARGCPACVPVVNCADLTSSDLCMPPACEAGYVRVSDETGCCERCIKELDCSTVSCAQPLCGDNEFACPSGPNSCCQTCCPKLDCSLVDCLVRECPAGSTMVVDERFCCGQCVPTECTDVACPAVACEAGSEVKSDRVTCCPTECVPSCDPTVTGVRCTSDGPACVVGLNDASAADTEAGRAGPADSNGCRQWNVDARCTDELKLEICRSTLPTDRELTEQVLTRMRLAGFSTLNTAIAIERRPSNSAGESCALVVATFYRACGADPASYEPPRGCDVSCDPAASDAAVASEIDANSAQLLTLSPDTQSSACVAALASVLIAIVLALL